MRIRGAAAMLTALAILTAAVACGHRAAGALVCKGSQLAAQANGFNGAAGTILFGVVLRNRSGSSCSVSGYPALQIVGAHGPIPTRTQHGGLLPLERPVRRVTLVPGAAATVLIAYGDVPVGKEASCPVGTELLVTPPGAGTAVPVVASPQACNRGLLRESPLLVGVVPAG